MAGAVENDIIKIRDRIGQNNCPVDRKRHGPSGLNYRLKVISSGVNHLVRRMNSQDGVGTYRHIGFTSDNNFVSSRLARLRIVERENGLCGARNVGSVELPLVLQR